MIWVLAGLVLTIGILAWKMDPYDGQEDPIDEYEDDGEYW